MPPASVGPPDAASGDPTEYRYSNRSGAAGAAASADLRRRGTGGRPGLVDARRGAGVAVLTDTAWACIDLNASVLVDDAAVHRQRRPDAGHGLDDEPRPGHLHSAGKSSASQLFWDYQATGEAFVIATARYSTGWPARFHVVPPWLVEVDMDAGLRRYRIGRDRSHRTTSSTCATRARVDDAHGHGPLEAGRADAARRVGAGPVREHDRVRGLSRRRCCTRRKK